MDAKKLLDAIIKDVEEVKESSVTAIETENLLAYLRDIDVDSFDDRPEFDLEEMKHTNQALLEEYKIKNAFQIETFKSVITVGANACRAFMIMNGGAAIALLAFLGNIWEKDSAPAASKAIALSLAIFCAGVLASGLCAGLTYFAQSAYGNSELAKNKKWALSGQILNVLACISGLLSLVAFGFGSFSAFEAMDAQLLKLK
ncbi:hypothetical protein [Pantoea agglomerans]|uniref:hypothetical protein n=1 Tax=Enterobacter agglomerans TaxID=549 RepID=UPI002542BCD2|nr:hypothetical protein [Pantoea agglomerans]MDK4215887.1 hypothetical protein [Pantoea agglomerans]